MKTVLAAAAIGAASVMPAQADNIEIRTNGTTPAVIGTAANFTGQAIISPLYPSTAMTQVSTGLVNFAPGARTVWHTHPAGQLLIVTAGQGWVQEDGKERRIINPGDAVWIPPRGEALAWRDRNQPDDAHRTDLHEGRQERRLAGGRLRRTIPLTE